MNYHVDKPVEVTDEGDEGGCIFCGKVISHLNDGGTAWLLTTEVAGKVVPFYYCGDPACAESCAHYEKADPESTADWEDMVACEVAAQMGEG